jgi:hypothetical protein
LAISTVYQKFALFSAGYFSRPLGRLGLRIVHRGRALVALALDGPFSLVRHHVLIFARHRFGLLAE